MNIKVGVRVKIDNTNNLYRVARVGRIDGYHYVTLHGKAGVFWENDILDVVEG